MSAKGGSVFTFSLPGGRLAPSPSSVTPLGITDQHRIDRNIQEWKAFCNG